MTKFSKKRSVASCSDISIKLPFKFDVQKLQKDLEAAQAFEFGSHPLNYHDGSWRVLNLIYSNGDIHYTHDGAFGFGEAAPKKTEVLRKCPYFEELLDLLPAEILMARLSAIPAGGRVLRHYDPVESADFKYYRFHIPIVTSRKVVFHLGFRRQIWRAGELWYGDFTFPHSIKNKSNENRVHLIIDLKESDEIKGLFPSEFFDIERIERRAKLRRKYKDYSWYITQIERLLGKEPVS